MGVEGGGGEPHLYLERLISEYIMRRTTLYEMPEGKLKVHLKL